MSARRSSSNCQVRAGVLEIDQFEVELLAHALWLPNPPTTNLALAAAAAAIGRNKAVIASYNGTKRRKKA